MSAPLITEQDAVRLNERVQDKINGRLFLCCNYMPTENYVISVDARYLTAIQDLYKFSIDTSCVIKNYYRFVPQGDRWKLDGLQRHLDRIQMLRAVQSHNQSDQNGHIEQQRLKEYQNWVAGILHKASPPDSQEDFAALYQELARMADEVYRQLELFVDLAAASPDQGKVIQDWINQTFHWYSNNTRRDLYYGRLENEYIRRALLSPGQQLDTRPFIIRRKVNRWIEEALFASVDRKLAEEENAIEKIDAALDPSFSQVKFSSEAQRASFLAALQEGREAHVQAKANLEQQRDGLETMPGSQYVPHFFKTLKDSLQEIMDDLDEKGQSYTLLPQDLLAMHVDRFFRDVPSPDGDF